MTNNSKRGFVIWLTGLPGSGKTTLSSILKEEIRTRFGLTAEVLDGDDVRKKLSPDLGFSRQDRELHAKRVAYMSHLLARNGVITIVGLISPYRSSREEARELIGDFVEVWLKCSIEACIKRDPKGLYKKAHNGNLSNLTGVQDPYEFPKAPEIVVDTESSSPNESVEAILQKLINLKYLN